jgi:hypothetical protein
MFGFVQGFKGEHILDIPGFWIVVPNVRICEDCIDSCTAFITILPSNMDCILRFYSES